LFGAIWVVIFLFPGIGILPLNFYDVGDHLVYLPSVGFVIMLAGLLEMLSKKAFKGVRAGYAFISVAVVLAVLFSFETYRGMRFWRNDNTLFTHLAAKAPSDVIFYMLGNVNLGLENIAKAEEAYTEALKYNDKNWRVWYGLSVVAHNREDYVATRRYLNEAQLSENLNKIAYTLIFNDLGNIYYLEKDYVKAKEFYLQALRMDSTYCEAIYNLGQVYQSMGRQQDAAECFESFNSLAPSMYDKQKNKVQLYLMK
jgi:tetratricopeptide (TPR) repeat protein